MSFFRAWHYFALSWLGIVSIGVVSAQAQAQAEPAPALSSISSLLELSNEEAAKNPAVDAIGTITFIDHAWGLLFLSEGTRGIFVATSPKALAGLGFGNRVRVRGIGQVGGILPIISEPRFEQLPAAEVAEPLPVGPTQLEDLRALDARWIQVTGLVVDRYAVSDRHGWLLAVGKHLVQVMPAKPLRQEHALRSTLGRFVSVRGHAHIIKDSDGRLSSLEVMLQDSSQAQVLPDPASSIAEFRDAPLTIREFLAPSITANQLASFRGWVTLSSGPQRYYVEDPTGAVAIRVRPHVQLSPGDLVEVLLMPNALSEEEEALTALLVETIGAGSPPSPRYLEPSEVPKTAPQGELIRVRGNLLNHIAMGSSTRLTLTANGVTFLATVLGSPDSDSDSAHAQKDDLASRLSRARMVELTGVCNMLKAETHQLATFELLVQDPNGIEIVTTRSLWNHPFVKSALVFLILAGIAGGLWVVTLRRRVHSQTASLRLSTAELAASREELVNLMALLHASSDAARNAIAIVGVNGNIIDANRRWQTIFGIRESLVSKDSGALRQLLSPAFADPDAFSTWWETFDSQSTEKGETSWELTEPKHGEVEVFTAPVIGANNEIVARLWSIEDISERRQLERSLVQAQKMEAVGRLAGGIAHDFNNLLTGIAGNLSVLKLNSDKPTRENLPYVDSAEAAARRAAELVKQMLGFSRQNSLQLEITNVNSVAGQLVELLEHSFEKTIELKQDFADDLWNVQVDGTHLEQVLMNLCVNAKDAMPDRVGRITIATRNYQTSDDENPADYVTITVRDDGMGMPEEVRTKIFEPFYTTKEAGKGTGLGLAMSYGIIEQHKGWIECSSEEGVGTCFSIYLPRCVGQGTAKEVSPETPDHQLEGSERVLIIDDEAVVRAVAQGVLRHKGYTVKTASDGKEGLDVISSQREEIDLVLLDLTMPRMTGKDAFREIKRIYPDLPVVVCSGYLVDLDGFAQDTGARPDGFVQKPYEMEHFLSTIHHVLHDAPSNCKGEEAA